MRLLIHEFELPLRHVFTISRGSSTVYRALVVELQQDGVSGYGEAGESAYYQATFDSMWRSLERVRSEVESCRLTDPEALWGRLDPLFAGDRFAQCALDCAAWDLWGKLQNKRLSDLWGLSLENLPSSDYTLGIDRTEVMIQKLEENPGWPVYKIKVGTPDDVATVCALRERTNARLRVDANGGWSDVEQALQTILRLEQFGVEFIEQPFPPDRWDAMRKLYSWSPVPLVADESCRIESDVDRCLSRFHGVNIKLVKCGGLTPALRMITRARKLHLQVMVGCMTESTVGISAGAQLLPLVDYADLDGAVLLAEDIATGVTIRQGKAHFPPTPGCGLTLLQPKPA